jgi:hypothetical protein
MARKIANAASLLASQRKRVEHTCPVCGTVFTGTTRAVYCSSPCKLKAWRAASRAPASGGSREGE